MKNSEISKQAKIIRNLVADFNKNDFLRTKLIDKNRTESDFDKDFNYPPHLTVEKIELDFFKMELLKNTLPDLPNTNKVILQLHGGGYVGALKNYYRSFAGLYTEVSKGASVLTIDYRVAPVHPYPCALNDAIVAYNWLLSNGYSENDIILAGDSAGGGLALCLCHYLKDHEKNLPLGLVLMSPWTDLTLSGSSYTENYDIDPVFGSTNDSLLYNNPYALNQDKSDKYISPLFGEFDDFPPMLIQVGSHEMLLSDSISLANKAKIAESKVKLSVYDGMFHVFQFGTTIMPESKNAWAEVGKFISAIIKS